MARRLVVEKEYNRVVKMELKKVSYLEVSMAAMLAESWETNVVVRTDYLKVNRTVV